MSCIQTNTQACALLYRHAFESCDFEKDTVLLDVCCGVGAISICLQRYIEERGHHARILGIDIIESAIQDARANAALNDMSNIEFLHGKAEVVLPEAVKSISRDNCITAFVDPPRGGLHPHVLTCLLHCLQIQRIVYISCNPESLLQNAIRLCTPSMTCNRPFKPVKAVPVDLFPHTYHCEAILCLERLS